MKKLALYHHWDKQDIVDDYVVYALKALLAEGFEIIFTTNSKLNDVQKKRLEGLTSKVVFRSNKGFDFGAWKEVLLGNRQKILQCDSLLLLNNSCFGPIFPLKECFDKMAALKADYWGLTSCEKHPEAPDHLHSYFVCFTPRVIKSNAFWKFWEKVWDYTDFWDAVYEGERRLTKELKQAGFKYRAVVEMKDVRQSFCTGIKEAFSLYAADYLIMKYRMPFVKIKAFAHDSYNPYDAGGVVIKALESVGSNYPREYIYNYLNRTMPLSWQKNLPERTQVFQRELKEKLPASKLKLAVITHVFYVDVLNEFIDYLRNIPIHCDFLITTTTDKDKKEIEERLKKENLNAKIIIRVVKNHGRDVYPWLTAFKDIQNQYDLCLKIHAKKSAYQAEAFGFTWHHFLMESLLATPDYVQQILQKFENDSSLGIMFPVCPPIVKLMSKHAIYEDVDLKEEWLKMLNIPLKGHEDMSIFPVGTMFWYRPKAMAKLLLAPIKPDIFPGEPFPISHSMAHGLERALPYIAQDAGYTFSYVIPSDQLVSAFHIYEDRLSSLMQISACGFELFYTKPGESFSAQKTTSALVETWNRTFAFALGDIKVSPNDRLWRLDFGNPGDLIVLKDIRYLDEGREVLFSFKENPDLFVPVGCIMEKRDNGEYFYTPLGNDPQIHVEFPKKVDPSKIKFIAVDMMFEENQSYIGDAFRYREELKQKNQLILDQQDVISRRDIELKQNHKLVKDQQAVLNQREAELKENHKLIKDQQDIISRRDIELKQNHKLVKDQQAVLNQRENELKENQKLIKDQQAVISQRDIELKQNHKLIKDQQAVLNQREAELKEKQDFINGQTIQIEKQAVELKMNKQVFRDQQDLIARQDTELQGKQSHIEDQKKIISFREEELRQRAALISDQQSVISQREEELKRRSGLIEKQQKEIQKLDDTLKEKGKIITDQEEMISAKEKTLKEKEAELQCQSEMIARKNEELAQKCSELESLNETLNTILNSPVWRWSAPARKFADKVRNIRKK